MPQSHAEWTGKAAAASKAPTENDDARARTTHNSHKARRIILKCCSCQANLTEDARGGLEHSKFGRKHQAVTSTAADLLSAYRPLGSKYLAGTDHSGSHVPAWAGSAPWAVPPHKVLTDWRYWVHIDMRIRALLICAHPLHKHELLSMTPHPACQIPCTGHRLPSMTSASTAADPSFYSTAEKMAHSC